MISYSQNFEDVLLARVFHGIARGFYVDVGAHDPDFLSITKHFYDSGWHGINLEPVPDAYRRFESLRPRDLNLELAAGREEGEAAFFIPADPAFATLDPNVAAQSASTLGDTKITATTVRVRPLNAVLEEHEVTHIDFLAIDVEGAEREVLEGLDLTRHRPVVIVCEATAPAAPLDFDAPDLVFTYHQWESLVTDVGYECVFFDGLNRFYLRDESESLRQRFAIPVGPVRDSFRRFDEEVVAAYWREREDVLRASRLEEKLRRAQVEQAVANGRIEGLTRELDEARQESRKGEFALQAARQQADAQRDWTNELERIVEALRYTVWSRDRRLDSLAGAGENRSGARALARGLRSQGRATDVSSRRS